MPQQRSLEPADVQLVLGLLAALGAVIGTVGTVIAFFLKHYWDKRDNEQRIETQKEISRREQEWQSLEAERGALREQEWRSREAERAAREAERAAQASQQASLREALIDSLRWFEGGTQKRSIGLSLVTANWDKFPDLQPAWLGILANQAVYLLVVADQEDELHKITNLKSIMHVLGREVERLDPIARVSLRTALEARNLAEMEGRATKGVKVESMELGQWWQDLGFNSWP
jgi:hypothetical protein